MKIEKLHVSAIDLGLQRIAPLAKSLQLTRFNVPVVMVGGTNGKGSIIRTLECLYTNAGYQVAAYTSPHLLHFSERLRYKCQSLQDAVWIEAFVAVEAVCNKANTTLSFFEFTTLAALLICRQLKLDLLLLEVGLGGRLDAVNVVDADVAVISNIALDHTDWLGDDREKIGFEKAGIFRKGQTAVCGDPSPPQTLLQAAEEKGVKLFRYQQDYWDVPRGQEWEWVGPNKAIKHLPKSSLKTQNIASALMVAELIKAPIGESVLRDSIKQIKLAGRYEVLQKHCKIVLDVAHNPQAAEYLAQRLTDEACTGKVHAVVGMLQDKDIAATLNKLEPVVTDWSFASLAVPRGADSQQLAGQLSKIGQKSCYTFGTVAEALQHALAEVSEEDMLLVFGSFHTVSQAKQYLVLEEH